MSGTTLRCRVCERDLPLAPVSACPVCHGPVDVAYDFTAARLVCDDGGPRSMWRYRDLLPHPPADLDTPGLTPLVSAPRLSEALGIELLLKLEDANPTHSFKDRIAGTAVASARAYGFHTICCASTGNLAEAIAARCAANGLEAVVLCPRGDLPLVPVPAYGARVFGVDGDFDDCRELERQLESLFPWGFVGGNLHAVAAEGAKTIAYEIFEQLDSSLPDAIISPAASGMLIAKLAQGVAELGEFGPSGSGHLPASTARRPGAARHSPPPGPTTGRSPGFDRPPRSGRSRSAIPSTATSRWVPRGSRAARSSRCRKRRSRPGRHSSPSSAASSPTPQAASQPERSSTSSARERSRRGNASSSS